MNMSKTISSADSWITTGLQNSSSTNKSRRDLVIDLQCSDPDVTQDTESSTNTSNTGLRDSSIINSPCLPAVDLQCSDLDDDQSTKSLHSPNSQALQDSSTEISLCSPVANLHVSETDANEDNVKPGTSPSASASSDNVTASLPQQGVNRPAIVKAPGPLTTRQKWGFMDSEAVITKHLSCPKSIDTIIHKGFGKFTLQKTPIAPKQRRSFYPPLSNAAYEYSNLIINRSMAPDFSSQLDGAAFVKDYILEKNEEKRMLPRQEVGSLGEQTAKKINWDRRLYTPEGGPSFSIATDWKDFVTAIDSAKDLGQEPFAMCGKCGKRHIPWGPPVSMQDRDTCYSMLPEWFPSEMFDYPWQSFINIMNHVVRYAEREQGLALNPNRMVWDKEYHEPTQEWRAVGRYGGWWKCRSGLGEGQESVPDLERRCSLCHRAKTQEELELEERIRKDEEKKIITYRLIEQSIRKQLQKDRAFVQARIRYEGQ